MEVFGEDETEQIEVKYCPGCGYDMDLKKVERIETEKRYKELLAASPIKHGDEIYIKKPNNDYWGGVGFRSIVRSIIYDTHFDRLIYENWGDSEGGKYSIGPNVIEDIELYTGQKTNN